MESYNNRICFESFKQEEKQVKTNKLSCHLKQIICDMY